MVPSLRKPRLLALAEAKLLRLEAEVRSKKVLISNHNPTIEDHADLYILESRVETQRELVKILGKSYEQEA